MKLSEISASERLTSATESSNDSTFPIFLRYYSHKNSPPFLPVLSPERHAPMDRGTLFLFLAGYGSAKTGVGRRCSRRGRFSEEDCSCPLWFCALLCAASLCQERRGYSFSLSTHGGTRPCCRRAPRWQQKHDCIARRPSGRHAPPQPGGELPEASCSHSRPELHRDSGAAEIGGVDTMDSYSGLRYRRAPPALLVMSEEKFPGHVSMEMCTLREIRSVTSVRSAFRKVTSSRCNVGFDRRMHIRIFFSLLLFSPRGCTAPPRF